MCMEYITPTAPYMLPIYNGLTVFCLLDGNVFML